jgi:hypothetical protein
MLAATEKNAGVGLTQEIGMYTRNVRIKLRANSVPEFRRLLEQKIIPLLRTQKGFQDEITLLTSQRNEAIAISSGITRKMRMLIITWLILTF